MGVSIEDFAAQLLAAGVYFYDEEGNLTPANMGKDQIPADRNWLEIDSQGQLSFLVTRGFDLDLEPTEVVSRFWPSRTTWHILKFKRAVSNGESIGAWEVSAENVPTV